MILGAMGTDLVKMVAGATDIIARVVVAVIVSLSCWQDTVSWQASPAVALIGVLSIREVIREWCRLLE